MDSAWCRERPSDGRFEESVIVFLARETLVRPSLTFFRAHLSATGCGSEKQGRQGERKTEDH